MKKAQFISPIILVFLILSYFIIVSGTSEINSALIHSRTNLLKITNDIKEIERMDLEWQADITKQALMLLSTVNSSGTINQLLEPNNAEIILQSPYLLMNYTKHYEYNGFSKTLSKTIIVPYPYIEFVQAEASIRNNCGTITIECVNNNKNNDLISAELISSSVLLTHTNYPLTTSYNYVMLFD